MKTLQIGSVVFALAALASPELRAQDKVTVPLSNPSQPATVRIHLMNGGITVTGGASGQVVVESAKGQSLHAEERAARDVPPGMKRIDIGQGGMEITEDHNVVTISSGRMGGSSGVVVQVPANASLQLRTMTGGSIDVSSVTGEIDADNMSGAINLKNVSGVVLAHTLDGVVTAVIDHVVPDKPMSFTSLSGKIDVTLPGDTKARLRLKTDNGAVYSDFDVKMEPAGEGNRGRGGEYRTTADRDGKPAVEDNRGRGGKYRIRVDRGVYGTINGGGPEYRFETMNGNILIHKK